MQDANLRGKTISNSPSKTGVQNHEKTGGVWRGSVPPLAQYSWCVLCLHDRFLCASAFSACSTHFRSASACANVPNLREGGFGRTSSTKLNGLPQVTPLPPKKKEQRLSVGGKGELAIRNIRNSTRTPSDSRCLTSQHAFMQSKYDTSTVLSNNHGTEHGGPPKQRVLKTSWKGHGASKCRNGFINFGSFCWCDRQGMRNGLTPRQTQSIRYLASFIRESFQPKPVVLRSDSTPGVPGSIQPTYRTSQVFEDHGVVPLPLLLPIAGAVLE